MTPFIGSHSCRLDSKGRLTIPAVFRRYLGAEGGETLVVSKGQDPCLRLYSPEGWRVFQEKLNALPSGKKKRQVIRFFSLNSAALQLDKQGRVGLPKDFLAEYGMKEDLQLVGAIEYIEVWRPQDLKQQVTDAPEALDELDELL